MYPKTLTFSLVIIIPSIQKNCICIEHHKNKIRYQ